MTLLVFGVVRTDRYAWTSPVTLGTLAAAVALLAAFAHVERTTARDPLIRLGLFANRAVAGANLVNLLVGAAMALGVVVGSVLAVKLGYRFAPRPLLVAGGLLTAAGFAWFGLISADGTFVADILGPEIVLGIGFGLCLGPLVATATTGVATRETGTAAGLLNSTRQIGASIGLAVLGTAAHQRTGPTVTPESLDDGYALGLTLCGALLVAAVLVALTVPRRPSFKSISVG